MSSTIAPLTDADRGDWEPLWAGYLEFYEHTLSDEQTASTYARILDPDVAMYGAIARDDDGRAVGIVHWLTHASTWSDDPYVYLEDLFVAGDVRGTGTGRALIDHVVGWARAQGLPKVYWQTAYTNERARRLYDLVAANDFIVYEIDLT
ncbi:MULTISPECIES: GNAT family N-acetyltransferase [unclassified Gordonia (in: high G+C Gram-positive bacteria)]